MKSVITLVACLISGTVLATEASFKPCSQSQNDLMDWSMNVREGQGYTTLLLKNQNGQRIGQYYFKGTTEAYVQLCKSVSTGLRSAQFWSYSEKTKMANPSSWAVGAKMTWSSEDGTLVLEPISDKQLKVSVIGSYGSMEMVAKEEILTLNQG